MGRGDEVRQLKSILRHEVALFCRNDGRKWKAAVVKTIRELRETRARAVFFGGTPRSLLTARLFLGRPGKPRDVDIVVQGVSVDQLQARFQPIMVRRTRFGGLKLGRMEWEFDVWPVESTWAFVTDGGVSPRIEGLPYTAMFNLEAVAVEVWPRKGSRREIYSGDDRFFEGILNEELELSREDTPYPELTVVRALILAASLDFRLGPRLLRFVAAHGAKRTVDELEAIQRQHYGTVRRSGSQLREWITMTIEAFARKPTSQFRIPMPRQASLWSSEPPVDELGRIRVFTIRGGKAGKSAPRFRGQS